MNISCLFLGRQLLAIWLIGSFIKARSLQEEINAKLFVQLDVEIVKATSKLNTSFHGSRVMLLGILLQIWSVLMHELQT